MTPLLTLVAQNHSASGSEGDACTDGRTVELQPHRMSKRRDPLEIDPILPWLLTAGIDKTSSSLRGFQDSSPSGQRPLCLRVVTMDQPLA